MSPSLSDLFLRSQSDERLVALARTGHDRAFVAIVERYRRQLLALARRLSSDGRAEDIVQQTFLSAWTALRAGAEVRHLRGWLHQIVRNAAITASAHRPIEAALDPETAADVVLADVADQRLAALTALGVVAGLPERQRAAFVGTAIQGRSRGEVAGSMGVSEGAVRQLVHRARASVRAGVTVITPYPVVQWLAARSAASSDRAVAIVLGAGSASAGSLALKVSALVVSASVAAGVVSPHLVQHRAGRTAPSPGAQGRSTARASSAALVASAVQAPTPGFASAGDLALRASSSGAAAQLVPSHPRGSGMGGGPEGDGSGADGSQGDKSRDGSPAQAQAVESAGGGDGGRGGGDSRGGQSGSGSRGEGNQRSSSAGDAGTATGVSQGGTRTQLSGSSGGDGHPSGSESGGPEAASSGQASGGGSGGGSSGGSSGGSGGGSSQPADRSSRRQLRFGR